MITLHDFPASGNCHKVRLLLSLLGVEYALHEMNGAAGEHKTPGFLTLNALGQVPVLEDGDIAVRDSQAILVYLARRYGTDDWLPADPAGMALVMQWLFTAANEVAHGPADLRLHYKFGRTLDRGAARATADKLYAMLERHLAQREWLETGRVTIADIAVYPYVALSGEAHLDLAPYPAITQWLARVQALPGYVGMPGMHKVPVGTRMAPRAGLSPAGAA